MSNKNLNNIMQKTESIKKFIHSNIFVRGFTLIELITVVIIVAILASLAVPNYLKTVERAKDKEAIVNLKLIKAAQQIYKLEHGVFFGDGPAPGTYNLDEINSHLNLDLNNNNWTYVTLGLAGIQSRSAAYRYENVVDNVPLPQNPPPQGYGRHWRFWPSYDSEPICVAGNCP